VPAPRAALPALAALLCLLVTACAGSDGAATGDAGRTVAHARGETAVPADPQRIVVLEPVLLDTAVALGAVPAGAAVLSEATGVPSYLGEPARGITVVGTVAAPDLERIAALQPDLVLGTESRHAGLYDQLSAIAPTAFLASQADPWQDNVRFAGRALGREEQTEQLLEDYATRCAEVARTHGTQGRTAQLIRPRDGLLTLYGPTSFAGSTLECAGLTLPPRDWEDSISVDLSPELVQEARADEVFLTAADPSSPDAVPPAVTAVRDSAFPRLHTVDQSFWITGVGPLGGQRVLDDIDRVLGG
jgi:iron complex transport system substrate-binding protein